MLAARLFFWLSYLKPLFFLFDRYSSLNPFSFKFGSYWHLKNTKWKDVHLGAYLDHWKLIQVIFSGYSHMQGNCTCDVGTAFTLLLFLKLFFSFFLKVILILVGFLLLHSKLYLVLLCTTVFIHSFNIFLKHLYVGAMGRTCLYIRFYQQKVIF